MLNKKQLEAYNKFKRLKVGALFMQMGMGKTRVAIDIFNSTDCSHMLVICPYSTINNFIQELHKWKFKKDYTIIAYETIQSSDIKYLKLIKKLETIGKENLFIIADESIFIKNEETKRFKRCLTLRNLCDYALILNGTPLTKNEWDLYNQMYFLSPLIINMNRSEFKSVFFKKINYKKRGEREKTFYKFSEVNAEYLYKLIEPYIFKSDLDFSKNEKETMNLITYYGTEYTEEKENKLNKIREQMYDSSTIINMLTSLNVIASCYEDKNKDVAKYIKGKRIIVYCNFIKEVEQIKKIVDCYVITGETKERSLILEKFKKDNKPLLLTYGVGAYGLNMQFCDEIVYSSVNFDYGKTEQSKYRIKRIGQNNDIKYTYILTDLGITKLIIENLKKKKSLKNLIEEKITKGEIEKWLEKNL